MISEFALIERYFTRPASSADLGVGDDCALLSVSPGHQLAVSTDMLVSGRHFFADVDPHRLGHKALAVNLSDLAAMGAKPRWFTLSLALPAIEEPWLAAFADGMFDLAREFGVELVGGDTTSGPLNICVQIMGEVPTGQALLRSGARPEDDVWISGTLGDAALALDGLQGKISLAGEGFAFVRDRLERPLPKVNLGLALRGLAHAAIDVSDGLLADLGHILTRSCVGAALDWESVPLSNAMRSVEDLSVVRRCALSGGDDYELCFTAPACVRPHIDALRDTLGVALARIGVITAACDLQVRDVRGEPIEIERHGYDHFA